MYSSVHVSGALYFWVENFQWEKSSVIYLLDMHSTATICILLTCRPTTIHKKGHIFFRRTHDCPHTCSPPPQFQSAVRERCVIRINSSPFAFTSTLFALQVFNDPPVTTQLAYVQVKATKIFKDHAVFHTHSEQSGTKKKCISGGPRCQKGRKH